MAGDKYAALRAEFVASNTATVRELAEAHGFDERGARRLQEVAARQGWQEKRNERLRKAQQISEKAQESATRRAAKTAAEKAEAIMQNAWSLTQNAQGVLALAIGGIKERGQATPAEAAQIQRATGEAVRTMMNMLGLPTEHVEHSGAVGNVSIEEYRAALREALEQT